ncbi:hypothetical protein IFM89_009455 [Coptis chinensis]|uniref:Transport inhibitor response 1 domain-containing protein n=1 Tax=Coptis chinensis TaxID=261450 RepID=A0A835M4G7_9MAGN|nr:hypothetical protein IFM89_009455 [Coptis chinensis]
MRNCCNLVPPAKYTTMPPTMQSEAEEPSQTTMPPTVQPSLETVSASVSTRGKRKSKNITSELESTPQPTMSPPSVQPSQSILLLLMHNIRRQKSPGPSQPTFHLFQPGDGDDATNISGSSVSASSKKRGPSIGIEEIEGQPRPKLVMQTNRKGKHITTIDVVSEFGTRLGYIARRDFPVCYEDWRHIGKDLKDKVVKTLGRQFVFEYEKTIDTDYTRQKLNEAWRNYKHMLYETFVEDEDPSLVKEVAPCNIPLEGWHKFVDYCNTDKFKAMSARNKLKIMPSSLGRTSVAIARNELALEKGIPESEITRADSYMLIHRPKETVPQSQEVLNSIKNHIFEHPESQCDLSGDSIATVVGSDKRGRFRGLGTGVCKTMLRKGDSLMKKNDGLMEANTLLERRMETMEANMDAKMSRHMEEGKGLFMSQRGTFNDNVPSPHSHASHHSTAPRLPRLELLKLKGKPRASMFNLIPEDWGGFSRPWIREIAEGFNCLKCLHFRRMIVMDEDLEILARSRGQMLQSLKLDKCSGFSTDGLLIREIMDEDSGTFRESKESMFANCNTLSLFIC